MPRYDKELIAQGVGNVLCGVLSALPITGVIVRSSANIDAGARTRLATILHGVWILLFVCLLPHTLQLIPKSCLGAILVYTGYKLAYPRAAMELLRFGKSELFIYLTTLITIVVEDLLTGVLVGIGLSIVKLLYTFSHLSIDVRKQPALNRVDLKLAGAATFLRLPQLARSLEGLPRGCEMHVDIEAVTYIDHACLDLLMSWEQQHKRPGGKLIIDWGDLHAKFLGRNRGASGRLSPLHKRPHAVGQH